MSRALDRRLLLCTALLPPALAACPDDPLTKLVPIIAVDPERLDFGDGIVDRDNVLELTIKDEGTGVLELETITVEPDAGIFFVRAQPERVAPIASEKARIAFVPRRAHEVYSGELVLRSNDPNKPELRVPLAGVGGVREIEVVPVEIDFGLVNEGTAPHRSVEIRNVGKDVLTVSELVWTSTSVDLSLVPGFRSGRIEALSSTVVEIAYSPVDLGADSATLTVRSDDEDEPEVSVQVRGRANLAPRAIAWECDKPLAPGSAGCDGMLKVKSLSAGFRRLVGIDGRETYDPEGGPILEYRWRVMERPQGSAATPFHSTEDTRDRKNATGDIEVDRVGRYDLRLVAKDENGLESLDRAESHVQILPRDLEVLLRWDVDTDVDLHVVRPGGAVGDYGTGRVGTSTGSDCASFNRQPDWGQPSVAADDPSLDKDDVSGRGPEIVSLDFPEDDGTYSAFAHYCDSRARRIPVNVVLEVYVRGERVAMVPASGAYPLVSGELWQGLQVTWHAQGPSAEVTDLSASGPVQAPTLCMNR